MCIATVDGMENGIHKCCSAAGVDSGFMKNVLIVCGIRYIVETGTVLKFKTRLIRYLASLKV